MAMPPSAAPETFSLFLRLPTELQDQIWFEYYFDFLEARSKFPHIHVFEVKSIIPARSRHPWRDITFHSTRIDADTGSLCRCPTVKPLICTRAFYNYTRVCDRRPDLARPYTKLDLALSVAVDPGAKDFFKSTHYPPAESPSQSYYSSRYGRRYASFDSLPNYVDVIWERDMIYLAGPHSEYAFWALIYAPWANRIHNLAVETPLSSITGIPPRYPFLWLYSSRLPGYSHPKRAPTRMDHLKTFRAVRGTSPYQPATESRRMIDEFGFECFLGGKCAPNTQAMSEAMSYSQSTQAFKRF